MNLLSLIWKLPWHAVIFPLLLIGSARRIYARRRAVQCRTIRPESIFASIWHELRTFISDPELAITRSRKWSVGDKTIGVIACYEALSAEEKATLANEAELMCEKDNHSLGIGPEKGDLLPECPLCGHWLAHRRMPKEGDRNAFHCEACGEHDLSGSKITKSYST